MVKSYNQYEENEMKYYAGNELYAQNMIANELIKLNKNMESLIETLQDLRVEIGKK